MIGHAQSCRRKNRPVAWIREELVNNREIAPEARPRADRDIGELEDAALCCLSWLGMETGPPSRSFYPLPASVVSTSFRPPGCPV